MDGANDNNARPPMTRTQRAGWVLLGVALMLTIAAMAIYAFTEIDMLTAMAAILGPVWTLALTLLGVGYKAKGEGD